MKAPANSTYQKEDLSQSWAPYSQESAQRKLLIDNKQRELGIILKLGFSKEQAEGALVDANGDLQGAVNICYVIRQNQKKMMMEDPQNRV